MSVIDIAVAMNHLLAEPEDESMVQIKLDAAEESAAEFLQRRFFVDQAAMIAARAAVPAAIVQTRSDYEAAMTTANLIENYCDRTSALEVALANFKEARTALDAVSRGLVINKAIVAACLLILGNLYANREDVVIGTISSELPKGSTSLLMPYRIKMGV
jgi:ethanolamine utilization microcompartment shell protein EutS